MMPTAAKRSAEPTTVVAQAPEALPKADDKAQSKAFIEKAREIGADVDRSASDELLRRLAKMPPQPKMKSKRRQETK